MLFRSGLNSLAYKISTERNTDYFLKKYFVYKGDPRNRFLTEFSGISFLWNNGIRAIPEPICADSKQKIGIYSFINGTKLEPGEITEKDVHAAASFLKALYVLSKTSAASKQPIASEACFSIQSYLDCIRSRLKRFDVFPTGNGLLKDLRSYLDDEFMPFLGKIEEFVENEAQKLNISLKEELDGHLRTLSPSDFGFHNTIRRGDGKLIFIDFEYYGWDDPAKMIADFYLQPAVPLPHIYRESFFKVVYPCFNKDKTLIRRLPLVYVILSLKWCLIMLNAFLKGGPSLQLYLDYSEQLRKAKNKIGELKNELKNRIFPISLIQSKEF